MAFAYCHAYRHIHCTRTPTRTSTPTSTPTRTPTPTNTYHAGHYALWIRNHAGHPEPEQRYATVANRITRARGYARSDTRDLSGVKARLHAFRGSTELPHSPVESIGKQPYTRLGQIA